MDLPDPPSHTSSSPTDILFDALVNLAARCTYELEQFRSLGEHRNLSPSDLESSKVHISKEFDTLLGAYRETYGVLQSPSPGPSSATHTPPPPPRIQSSNRSSSVSPGQDPGLRTFVRDPPEPSESINWPSSDMPPIFDSGDEPLSPDKQCDTISLALRSDVLTLRGDILATVRHEFAMLRSELRLGRILSPSTSDQVRGTEALPGPGNTADGVRETSMGLKRVRETELSLFSGLQTRPQNKTRSIVKELGLGSWAQPAKRNGTADAKRAKADAKAANEAKFAHGLDQLALSLDKVAQREKSTSDTFDIAPPLDPADISAEDERRLDDHDIEMHEDHFNLASMAFKRPFVDSRTSSSQSVPVVKKRPRPRRRYLPTSDDEYGHDNGAHDNGESHAHDEHIGRNKYDTANNEHNEHNELDEHDDEHDGKDREPEPIFSDEDDVRQAKTKPSAAQKRAAKQQKFLHALQERRVPSAAKMTHPTNARQRADGDTQIVTDRDTDAFNLAFRAKLSKLKLKSSSKSKDVGSQNDDSAYARRKGRQPEEYSEDESLPQGFDDDDVHADPDVTLRRIKERSATGYHIQADCYDLDGELLYEQDTPGPSRIPARHVDFRTRGNICTPVAVVLVLVCGTCVAVVRSCVNICMSIELCTTYINVSTSLKLPS
ncbi:uncharacterized protein BXZ73DRAFT_106884 [Epithele typhae]|uniref:uncharacterized protein n=1 Tax=Epithele typhae TaxID=378194 RepID=UPI0020078007|nr:uncharacterized protein BXZ73DRAFT_106884 [Epithele typhae]KAH9913705.1 hypothetical protein BXZ73DRAFT_106884 [Epithele typhae]